MKIYIAGASAELARCKEAITIAREAGLEITQDWTLVVEMAASLTPEAASDPAFLKRCAAEDMQGIEAADVFWLLLPEAESQGALFEFGYAVRERGQRYTDDDLDRALEILISGPRVKTVLWTQADRKFTSDAEALAYILDRAVMESCCACNAGEPFPAVCEKAKP